MKIDGQCHCGRVRYEATVDPENVSICHCTDCQAMSGSAFRTNVRVADADFSMTGEVTTYAKTAASGNQRIMSFCPVCGTHICAMSGGEGPKRISVRLATSNQRADLPPKRQIWCQSAMPWVNGLANLAGSATQD